MNRYLLTGVVILACICITISIAYACVYLYIDAEYEEYVGVGDPVYIYAWVSSGGPVTSWDWDWPSGFYNVDSDDDDYDSNWEGTCDTAGKYTIEVEATGPNGQDDDETYVYVVEVRLYPSKAFVPLYNDDENELVQVGVSLEPSELNTGKVILNASNNIRVWYDSGKQYEVTPLPTTWYVYRDQVPSSVWVGGTSPSSSIDDAWLEISYKTYWSPILDSETVNFTVLNVEITEPDGDGPPDFDHQFVFDEDIYQKATCTIDDVEGETGTEITALDNVLEWELDSVGRCVWESDPDPAVGSYVTFDYTDYEWPLNNSDFGQKALMLEHPDSGFTDTLTVEIFFAKNVAPPPPDDTPNWFYYWKEGGVVSDLDQSEEQGFFYESGGYSGWYQYWDDTLWVSDLAPESSGDVDVDLTNKYYQTSINTGPDGICDTVAVEPDEETGEEGDIQVYATYWPNPWSKPMGEPDAVAITDGGDGIQTTPGGDDQIVGSTITTGANGKCETNPAGTNDQYVWYGDIQMANGNGKPYTTCITAGTDGFLHSADNLDGSMRIGPPYSDDELDLTGANTEPFSIDLTGIYKCSVTCIHELKHRELYQNVKIGGSPPNIQYDDTYDGDYVKDYDEVNEYGGYHLDPQRKDTYDCYGESEEAQEVNSGVFDDNEFIAYITQGVGTVDSSIDWSDTDGTQWHQ